MFIFIGTSGWAYREWQGGFYPAGMKSEAHLAHYVTRFNAAKINGTAYRTPREETVQHWSATMPAGFTAAVKWWHAITHFHRLRDSGALLSEFISSVRHLAGNRGPVLAQLPYQRRHGTDGRNRGSYDDRALHQDADLICEWAAKDCDTFTFFNNTADGAAVLDARRLQDLVAAHCGHQRPSATQQRKDAL